MNHSVLRRMMFSVLSRPKDTVGFKFVNTLLIDKMSNRIELSSLLTLTGKSGRLPSSTVNRDATYLLNSLATSEGNVMTLPESSISMELWREVLS